MVLGVDDGRTSARRLTDGGYPSRGFPLQGLGIVWANSAYIGRRGEAASRRTDSAEQAVWRAEPAAGSTRAATNRVFFDPKVGIGPSLLLERGGDDAHRRMIDAYQTSSM